MSRDEATRFAHEQYDAFARRRRLAAEEEADTRYIEDLRQTAQTVAQKRKKE